MFKALCNIKRKTTLINTNTELKYTYLSYGYDIDHDYKNGLQMDMCTEHQSKH